MHDILAYEKGYDAYYRGADWGDCPYDEGTEDYFRWHIGWDDAAFEFSYYAYDDDEE